MPEKEYCDGVLVDFDFRRLRKSASRIVTPDINHRARGTTHLGFRKYNTMKKKERER